MPAQSFFTRISTETRIRTKLRFVSKTKIKSRLRKTSESGFSLKDKKSKFSLMSDMRSRSTNFKPILIEEVSRNRVELLILSEWKLIMLLQGVSNPDEINYYFKKNYQKKIGIFVKLMSKVFMRWKNWREFKSYEPMNFREEDWSNIRTLFMNSRADMKNYRMTSIVWMTRKILRLPSQYAVDHPQFPGQPALFPSHRDPGWLLSRNNQPPDIWNSQGISGNVFVNPPASSSSPCPGGFNPWISNVTEDTSPHVTSERQNPDTTLDPRCQSGPSARNSFDPKEGRSSKDYGADQQRLQISDLEDEIHNWGVYLFTISYGS